MATIDTLPAASDAGSNAAASGIRAIRQADGNSHHFDTWTNGFCSNCAPKSANKGGMRGRRYPGSLLSERLKKTNPNTKMQIKNRRRSSQATIFLKRKINKGVQGNKAASSTGK